jgi:hypothetical protein
MTPQEFKIIWTNTGDALSPLTSKRLPRLNLQPRTMEFLTQAGLPVDAAPFLSFVDDSEEVYKRIDRLTDQHDFLGKDFATWIVIGSCSDGDPIAINAELNDQIDWLDRDNYFEPGFFNSSIEALAECLVIYRNFVFEIQKTNGENAFLNGDFSDSQFETLRSNLLEADCNVFIETGFWKEQLEIDFALRKNPGKRRVRRKRK